MMLEETEIGEMMRGCRGGGVALGAWIVATVTEICTDAETIL
jgi:hypothetical protein